VQRFTSSEEGLSGALFVSLLTEAVSILNGVNVPTLTGYERCLLRVTSS
jgi:hypothetical protein